MSAPAWMQLVAYLAILLLLAWPLARAIDAVMQRRFALGRRIEAPLYRLWRPASATGSGPESPSRKRHVLAMGDPPWPGLNRRPPASLAQTS